MQKQCSCGACAGCMWRRQASSRSPSSEQTPQASVTMSLSSSSGAATNASSDKRRVWGSLHILADNWARCVQSRQGRYGQGMVARRRRRTAEQARWATHVQFALCRAAWVGNSNMPCVITLATTQEPSPGVLLRLLQLLPLLHMGRHPAASQPPACNWVAASFSRRSRSCDSTHSG